MSPRRKEEPQGLTLAELNAATGTSRPQIRRWVRAGLLPRTSSRGRGARYDAAFVERVRTIDRLLVEEGRHLEAVRVRLGKLDAAAAAPPAPPAAPTAAAAPALPTERWERLVLLPGLELIFRADAGAVLRRMATEIWRQFGAAATDTMR